MCSGSPASCMTAPREKMKETSTAPGQITLITDFGSRLPNSSISSAPANGNSGISQIESRKFIGLPFHQVDFVGIDGFLVAEQRNDDAQAHRGLGRRIDDDK